MSKMNPHCVIIMEDDRDTRTTHSEGIKDRNDQKKSQTFS